MKMNHIILILLTCLLTGPAFAKVGKVKYAKNVIYKGAVAGKVPDGEGTLTIYSRVHKKDPLMTIGGKFHIKPQQSSGVTVTDAELRVKTGLTFTAQDIMINVKKEKESECVDIELPKSTIINNAYTIRNNGDLSITLNWSKERQKEWILNMYSYETGVIDSNFMTMPQHVTDRLKSLNVKPVQQTINFSILQENDQLQLPYDVEIQYVYETVFDSGLKVSLGNNVLYDFSDGSSVEYDREGKLVNCSMMLPDGSISYDHQALNIAYKNGDKFTSYNGWGLDLNTDDILQIMSLKDLILKDGTYHHAADDTDETYVDGVIVERRLVDGTITLGKDSRYEIKYDDGRTFTGTDKDFIKNPEKFLDFTTVSEAVLNTGRLTKSHYLWDTYENGTVTGGQWPLADGGYAEYDNKCPIKVMTPHGGTYSGNFVTDLSYDPELASTDFILSDGTYTGSNGNTIRYRNGKGVLKSDDDVRQYARNKGDRFAVIPLRTDSCNLNSICTQDHNIVLKTLKEAVQINKTDFYLNVAPNYHFSYPKSFITIGYNIMENKYWDAETCYVDIHQELNDEPYWPGDTKSYIIWLYVPVANKNGIQYGKSTGLYIIDKKTHDVLYDLSDTFVYGNNRSFRKVGPAPKKKTYHERGRIEDCGWCLGTGSGWQGGICPFCGGKGWYIEHEW